MNDPALPLALATLLATAAAQDRPTPPAEPAARLEPAVWQGYLFRDQDGSLRLGWPVVAMGVMATAPHTLAPRLAERLAPLATAAKSDWTFLNYLLEKDDVALATVPRLLVRLRGKVDFEGSEEEAGLSSRGRPCTMHEARLEAVEFVPEAWLERWALFFRDKRSPFRVARQIPSEEQLKAFAPLALAALRGMRAVPAASDDERAKVQAIEPEARIVDGFRREKEWQIQRWLTDFAKDKGLELPGLDELGPLPPSSVEIQRWFLAASDKQAFLDRVGQAWPSPDDLSLVHYAAKGRSTSYTTTEIAQVRAWSDEEFARLQATTRTTLGGR